MKNKLILLTLISITSNSFCAEMKEEDFNKEFTIQRGMVDVTGDIGIIRIIPFYGPKISSTRYYIPRDSDDFKNIKQYAHYKFVLKRIKVVPIPFLRENYTPVKIVRFEQIIDENSCTIL